MKRKEKKRKDMKGNGGTQQCWATCLSADFQLQVGVIRLHMRTSRLPPCQSEAEKVFL